MATNITSKHWAHTDMSADILCTISYDVLSRSGSTFKIRVYTSAKVVTDSGGEASSESRYGYGVHATLKVNNDSGTDVEIVNKSTYADTPLRGGGGTLSAYRDYTYTVGTSSGSISVSAAFHSDHNGSDYYDNNACHIGPTLTGSIPYSSTNTAPSVSSITVPSDAAESISVSWVVSDDQTSAGSLKYWLQGRVKDDDNTIINLISEETGTTSKTIRFSDYWTDSYRGRYFQFRVKAKDANGAESSWSGWNGAAPWNIRPDRTSSVWTNESYALSSTTVKWNSASDANGHSVYYKINVYKNDSYYATYESWGTSLVFNFAGSDAADTRYTFGVITVDSLGATSAETKGGQCRKAVAPSPPTSVSIDVKYGTSSMSVKWSGAAASCAGQQISGYKVYAYKAVPGGGFVSAGTWTTGSTYASLNIEGDSQGTQYKFKIAAYTTLGGTTFEGNISIDSNVGKKDSKANKPSSISTYDIYNNPRYYFIPTEKIRIKWTPGSPADPDSDQTMAYFIYYSKKLPNGSWTSWSLLNGGNGYTTRSTSYDFTMDSNDPRGTQYKFQVYAAGIISGETTGFTSDPTETLNISYKNQVPNMPTNFAPSPDTVANYIGTNPNKYCYESEVTLNWTAANNNDSGQSQSYAIYVKRAAAGSTSYSDWSLIASGITDVTYTVTGIDSNGDSRGTQYIYGIQTYDGLEYSQMQASAITTHKNNIPDAPTMVYPKNGAVLNDLKPRIAITINSDKDNQGQTIYVTWAGIEYNSKDHEACFSRNSTSLGNLDRVLFKPPVDGSIGANTIKIRTYDGFVFSSINSYTVNIQNQNFTAITENVTKIAPLYITQLRTAINNMRSQYNLSAYSFSSDVATGKFVKLADIQSLRAAIDDIRNLLNGWDSTNTTLDRTQEWSRLISEGNIYFDKFRVQIEGESFIDIDDKATGISFNGTWNNVSDSNDFGGSTKVSNSVGSVIFYTFNGQGIEWFGDKNITAGKAKVTVDGEVVNLDLCTRNPRHQQMLFHKLDMPSGQHTIRIEALGGSNLYIDNAYFTEIKDMLMNL